jgi:hypothetical protein
MSQIILFLIFLAEYLTSPKALLFYDQIEYLTIVSTHNFLQVLPLGHFPIHPIFLAIFWITSRLVLPNLTAFIFGVISGLLMYQISKIIFKKGNFWLATVIFLLFPGVWLINTNLMTQSLQLTLYLFSIYFLFRKMKKFFFLAIIMMMGVDIGSIVWIPTVFIFPIIFEKEIKYDRKKIFQFIKIAAVSVLSSIFVYWFIYYFIRRDFSGSTEQLFAYSSSGVLRLVRNAWFSFIYSFGRLTPFILLFILFKRIRSKSELLAWIIFFTAVSVLGAFWAGDLMMRRIVFAGVLIALVLYKYLREKSFWIIVYLLPVIVANGILYYRGSSDIALTDMQKHIDKLPKGQVLIETHYLAPFTKYDGTILWIGQSDLGKIDDYLNSGKRVFITKQAITAPYMLLVGNNYHITSLGRVGESESRLLFKKYIFDAFKDNLEIKLFKGKQISGQAGEPVIAYDRSFWGRLARRRIDYGDIGSWVWAIITNHRDPIGWTYKDAGGVCTYCPGS